jgi:hypothetical protein
MNEDHKKRGLTHSKLLTAVAISSLLLSSGNVMAAQTASNDSQRDKNTDASRKLTF